MHYRLIWGLVSISLAIAACAGRGVNDAYNEDAAVRDLMECKLSYMIGPHAPAAPSNVHDAPRFFADPRLATYGPGFYKEL